MIIVPAYIDKSNINGKGLFAARDIPKGAIVVKTGRKEIHYTKKQYNSFHIRYQKTLDKYAYWENSMLIYQTDEVKYSNHSCNANVIGKGDEDVAVWDIKKGEELTYNYHSISSGQSFACNCGSYNCKGYLSNV